MDRWTQHVERLGLRLLADRTRLGDRNVLQHELTIIRQREVGLGYLNRTAAIDVPDAIALDVPLDVLDEHADDDQVAFDIRGHLPVGQVLLVGARADEPEVVDLDIRDQRLQQVPVAVSRTHPHTGRLGITEQQDPIRSLRLLALELVLAKKAVLVRACEPGRVMAAFD
jgi:hypothetical protein